MIGSMVVPGMVGALRFKKSKSFCSLIPEKNNLKILIVFGTEEREENGENITWIKP